MPATKIVNMTEVLRWIEEGRTYQWMVDQYREKYNIDIKFNAFANIRYRRGMEERVVRDTQLIPWKVRPEHMADYIPRLLRAEARRRAGRDVNEADAARLENFKANLEEENAVVHYDPELPRGFVLVPRREGIDKDLIREPGSNTSNLRRKRK